MLELKNLTYAYGSGAPALDALSASVDPGLCLLMGENGAGKTTLLNLCDAGLIPSAGTVALDGDDVSRRDPAVLRRIFFLPADYLSPFRTIEEAARCHAPFYPRFDAAMLAENLAAFALTGKERLRGLSLGVLHKANIAFALALRPELLLLDEPANGLDILSRKELRRMVSRCLAPGQIVMLSTHNVDDLQMLYDSVMLLHRGRLLLHAPAPLIQERLSFVSAPCPPPGALYCEPDGAAVKAVMDAADTMPTAIDYQLLYAALLNDTSGRIIELLNSSHYEE